MLARSHAQRRVQPPSAATPGSGGCASPWSGEDAGLQGAFRPRSRPPVGLSVGSLFIRLRALGERGGGVRTQGTALGSLGACAPLLRSEVAPLSPPAIHRPLELHSGQRHLQEWREQRAGRCVASISMGCP